MYIREEKRGDGYPCEEGKEEELADVHTRKRRRVAASFMMKRRGIAAHALEEEVKWSVIPKT